MTFTRKRSAGIIAVQLFVLVLGVILAFDAHAYIDPGTGSYLLQMALAALLGAFFSIKVLWRRIKIVLKRVVGIKNDEQD